MFRRRTSTEPATSDPTTADPADANGAQAKQSGKGRPTPKRRDSQPSRRPLGGPPKDRKEAVRRQREDARLRRAGARESMASGDDRYLPARDKGPVRRYVRDVVDSRRSVAEYFLPAALVSFLISSFGARNATLAFVSSLAFYGMLLLIVVDTMFLNRRLRSELAANFPGQSTRGVGFYALTRGLMIRRMRFPKPQLKRGDTVVPRH
ncbi:MAG TPA: DUF3043 domain-containing protein [Actinomycetes bacterium]|nr:DUF3043 domain-containing protein [Actinomycetes bacterium]